MTTKWLRKRKTSPKWCNLKACMYSITGMISYTDYCVGCRHLKADWRLP